jgi:hypothetical protein
VNTESDEDEDDDGPERSGLRRLVGILLLLTIPLVVVWWPGCRQYPPVSSQESLGLMKLLYSACNTKDAARLAKVEQGVETAAAEGKLSDGERKAFEKVIGMAKSGDWKTAENEAFKFAQDQMGQGKAAE